MERYLKKRHQIDSTITTKDILIRTTKVLFSYFDKFIGNSNIDDGTFYGIYLGQYLILAFCSKFISGKLTHYQIDDKIGIKNILAEIDKKTPNDIMEIIIKLEIVLREIDYQEKPFKGSTDITNEFFDERITIIINNNQYYTSFSELFNTAHPVQNPFSILKMKINEFITSYIFNLKLIDDLTTKDQSNKDGIILEQNLKFVIYSLISSGFLESSFAGYIRNKYFFKNI